MKVFTYEKLGKNGRLGNQLWQIAWQIGSADKCAGAVSVQGDWVYRKYFSLPDYWYERPDGKIVDGGDFFYQELVHWDQSVEKVKEAFSPSAFSLHQLDSRYPLWLLDDNVPKAFIHFRLGDYIQYPGRFPRPSMDYYVKSMELIYQRDPKVRFVGFSDDYNFLSSLKLPYEFYPVRGIPRDVGSKNPDPSDQYDLFLMSMCDYGIVANSTFSWWGAFLGGCEFVTYPSVWFGPELVVRNSMGKDIRTAWKDGIPSSWIEVEC